MPPPPPAAPPDPALEPAPGLDPSSGRPAPRDPGQVDRDAIAAVATAPGHAAIGIVRASGAGLAEVAQRLCGIAPRPRQAHLASFADAQGRALDTGLLLYFPAPNSFTGEDVLELQAHGSPAVLHRLVQRLCQLGCRQARPGEFSLRAYLNGKLGLVQAEAMADLIQARTPAAAAAAAEALGDGAAQRHAQADALLVQARVQLEAALDFPDEHLDLPGKRAILALLEQAGELLLSWHRRGQLGMSMHRGLRAVLAGPPNVGKSTLLNALCGQELALVSDAPGTTRDAVGAATECCGVPVELVDTAGLRARAQADQLEARGMKLGLRRARHADLLLLLSDGAGPDPARLLADELPELAGIPALRVRTKADLLAPRPLPKGDADAPPARAKDGPLPKEAPDPPADCDIAVSARTGQGLDQLRQAIASRAAAGAATREQPLWANQRHLDSYARAARLVQQAGDDIRQDAPELAGERLRDAADELAELIAPRSPDALLGEIFSRFCIGK